jgi:hypothetical protein
MYLYIFPKGKNSIWPKPISNTNSMQTYPGDQGGLAPRAKWHRPDVKESISRDHFRLKDRTTTED